jgi:hypothetical protein
VAHVHGTPAGHAHYGKGFGQQLFQGGALGGLDLFRVLEAFKFGGDARAEFGGFGLSISASRALMAATEGIRRLMARSFAVPKILVSILSKNKGISVYQCKWRGL